MPFGDLTGYDRVIVPENEGVVLRLILQDAELSVYIILHLIVITVQMIRCYIQYNSDIRSKVVHIIQLERAELNHIIIMLVCGYLQGKTFTYVTSQSHIQTCTFENVVNK